MSEALLLGPDRDGTYVLCNGDQVAYVGPKPPHQVEAQQLGCENARLVPGRVNAHTHLYSGLVPFGMPAPTPPPRNFLEILQRIWWRLDRALDAASLRAAARLYVAEALLAGTTALIDHHESPEHIEGSLDILADACQELGVRSVLCYGITERNRGRDEARQGLAECARFVETNSRPCVRGVVGLHASFTVSDAALREVAALCEHLAVPVHVHVAEDVADVAHAKAQGFAGPLERLEAHGVLRPGAILAHGVHLDAAQVRRAAELGAWLVQNPRSNAGNRVGYPSALGHSPRVALGTDGFPADMQEEARALAAEASAHGEPPEVTEPRADAGHALIAERFGSAFSARLAEGCAADVVALASEGVRHVVVGGTLVVGDGRLLTGDLDNIRTEAQREAARLWQKMEQLA